MNAFVAAGGGFLLAVLWFDLMFDTQVLGFGVRALAEDEQRRIGGAPGEVPEQALASIAAYYARVTTAARPMPRLIAATMIATIAAIVLEIAKGTGPGWLPWASLALAVAPIALAGSRTVPAAIRLGTRRDPVTAQSALARRVFAEHVFCFASIACLIGVQLGWG